MMGAMGGKDMGQDNEMGDNKMPDMQPMMDMMSEMQSMMEEMQSSGDISKMPEMMSKMADMQKMMAEMMNEKEVIPPDEYSKLSVEEKDKADEEEILGED